MHETWTRVLRRKDNGGVLPTRAEELLEAWRTSHREKRAGRICSLVATRERRLILKEAEEAGGAVLKELVQLIDRDNYDISRRIIVPILTEAQRALVED